MKNLLLALLVVPFLLFAESGKMRLAGASASDAPRELTQKELLALPVLARDVFDPYDKNSFRFEGVSLADFVKKYGDKDASKVIFKALDGYSATFSKSEWEKELILIACKKDGKFLRTKDKGPFRVIYPNYDIKSIDKLALFDKWIWMINYAEFVK